MPPRLWFLIDAQLPPRLARQLEAAGYGAAHVTDRLPATATDVEIARLANELGAAVVSKDEDFIDLARRGVLRTACIWVRIGNVGPARLWSTIGSALPRISQRLEAGERIIEVR